MAFITPFTIKSRGNEHVLLNGTQIPGIQSVDINYATNAVPLLYLGNSNIQRVPRGPQLGRASISSQIISDDYFVSYTGNNPFNLYLLENRPFLGSRREIRKNYDVSVYGFISGYLVSYNQSCSLGEIPRTQAEITVVGDVGQLNTNTHLSFKNDWINNVLTDDLDITYSAPHSYNTLININEISSNRVLSYNINIDIEREPVYVPGIRVPVYILTKRPIIVEFETQIELGSLQMDYMSKYPNQLTQQNISLELQDFESGFSMLNYNFDNMTLVEQTRIATVENFTVVNLRYQGVYL